MQSLQVGLRTLWSSQDWAIKKITKVVPDQENKWNAYYEEHDGDFRC